jgi:LPS sulfotransferase NodH
VSRRPPRSCEEQLALFGQYVGEERVREIADELGVTHRGSFRTPEKILAILFASRSGSNFLGQLLSSTGWFTEIGESFRPSQLTKIRDRYRLLDRHEAAQWMIDNRGTKHAFGFKAGFTVLISAAELGFLPEVLDRTQFVVLRRRDRIAQAVSLVKSKLSGRNHTRQPVGRLLSDADYDPEAIACEIANIKEIEGQLVDFADRFGKAAPIVYYEDICARPQEHVEQICDLIELKVPPDYEPKVTLSVLRDDLSALWVERFRAEAPRGSF